MATFSLADMSGAFSTVYRELVPQVQRKAPTLRLLAAAGRMRRSNTGDQIRWDARFPGQAAGAVNPDGGAFLTATSGLRAPASLAFGTYEAPVLVTDALRWRAEASAGLDASVNVFANLIDQAVPEAIETLVKTINQSIFTGNGAANTMLGLSSYVTNSGTVAGINSATYPNWVSYVSGNAGVLRSLTLAMIKTATRTISQNSAFGRPDIFLTNGAIMDAVEALFEAYTKVEYNPSGGMTFPTGSMEKLSTNPGAITTAGGRINVDGFRVFKWENQNLWFIEDPDAVNTAVTNTNNIGYLLNSADMGFPYLPPPEPNRYGTPQEVVAAAEQQLGPLANLQLSMTARGRTKHATEWDVMTMLAIQLKSRNSHGLLFDIQ